MQQPLPHFFRPLFPALSFVNRRWLSTSLSVFLGLGCLTYYFASRPDAIAFVQAERTFAKWAASPQDELLFQEMTQALKRVPQLQQKYEPILIQKLIEGGKGAEALKTAHQSLELAKKEIPFHASYAETSLLIEQGLYQTSLERAVALKEEMGKQWDINRFTKEPMIGGALLYAHNLIRVACLHRELKNRPGEKAAWEELERLLHLEENSPLAQQILSSFHDKGVDLSDYILERKSALD